MAVVVLVHGLFGAFGDERTWSRLAPHRVVVPDLLGYGEHAGTPAPVSLDGQVEHLRELLGEEPVHLVGHSVGGVIAMLYAHRYPDDVLALVNVEGNFTLADAFWSAEFARMPAVEAEALLEAYRADPADWFGGTTDAYQLASAATMLAFQPASTVQATAAGVVAVTAASTWEPLVRDVLARTPVHLVAGQLSRQGWHVPDWALAAAASYTELPGVGHAMMFERPEEFGDALAAMIPESPVSTLLVGDLGDEPWVVRVEVVGGGGEDLSVGPPAGLGELGLVDRDGHVAGAGQDEPEADVDVPGIGSDGRGDGEEQRPRRVVDERGVDGEFLAGFAVGSGGGVLVGFDVAAWRQP